MTANPKISITITIAVEMEPEWIWPNGDVPAEITEDAVREAMTNASGRELDGPVIVRLARDWDLDDLAEMTIRIDAPPEDPK